MTTVIHQLIFLQVEAFQKLTQWEKKFVNSIVDGLTGQNVVLSDYELMDHLSQKQIARIKKIFEKTIKKHYA